MLSVSYTLCHTAKCSRAVRAPVDGASILATCRMTGVAKHCGSETPATLFLIMNP